MELAHASASPEVLEVIGRQLRVADGMLDILVPQVGLRGPYRPLLASANPQAWRSMCGWGLKGSSAALPARSTMRAKPAVMKGLHALGGERIS